MENISFRGSLIPFNINNFCRCCLSANQSLYEGIEGYVSMEDQSISIGGTTCLEVYQSISSIMPHIGERPKICSKCVFALSTAYSFRQLCKDADRTLQQLFVQQKETIKNEPIDQDALMSESESTVKPELEIAFVKVQTSNTIPTDPDDTYRSDDDATPFRVKRKFQCKKCFKYFRNITFLKNHMDSHNTENIYSCTICKTTYKYRVSLLRHLQFTKSNPNHTKAGMFKCEECPKNFHDPRNLKNHIRSNHLKIKPFKCAVEGCDKEYIKQQNLWEHSFMHTDGILPFHCPAEDCELKTKSRAFFREHLMKKHKIIYDEAVHGYTGTEPIQCNKPPKTEIKPTESGTLLCTQCSRTFTNLAGLNYHVQSQHLNIRYQCDECDKTFTTKQQKWEHSFDHKGYLPYQCKPFVPECNTQMRLKKAFKLHLLKKHNICYDETLHGYKETESERFSRIHAEPTKQQKGLRKTGVDSINHEQLNFKCNDCPESFSNDNKLRYHVRRKHSQVKPHHQCKICNQTGYCKIRMWEHAFVHKGFYPFNCPDQECDYKTKKKLSFQYHLKKYHDIEYDQLLHGYNNETEQEVLDSILNPLEKAFRGLL